MKIKRILIRASHGAAVGGVSLTILMLLALGLFGLFAGLTGGVLSFLGSFISNLPAESYFSGVFCGAICASVASIFTHGQKGAAVRSALYGGFVGALLAGAIALFEGFTPLLCGVALCGALCGASSRAIGRGPIADALVGAGLALLVGLAALKWSSWGRDAKTYQVAVWALLGGFSGTLGGRFHSTRFSQEILNGTAIGAFVGTASGFLAWFTASAILNQKFVLRLLAEGFDGLLIGGILGAAVGAYNGRSLSKIVDELFQDEIFEQPSPDAPAGGDSIEEAAETQKSPREGSAGPAEDESETDEN